METYYNYVLRSLKDNNLYIGYTSDIDRRMKEHKNGLVSSTKYRRPFMLIYYEVSYNHESAIHREKYLKTTYGHRYLKNRIREKSFGIPI